MTSRPIERAMRLERALVRCPTKGGRRWLSFEDPIEQFIAHHLDDVLPTIERIDNAAHNGQWLVGMVSYDAAPAFDTALAARRDPSVPLVAFASFSNPRISRGPNSGEYQTGRFTTSCDQREYESTVSRIREMIAAGDTYQVNFTMRFHSEFHGDAEAFFAEMSRAQLADHLSYLDFGQFAVCSASPELFLRRMGRDVVTKPMKGTRPRHPDPVRDRTLANDLAKSEKDRAENTMIVDMCRNDLGRIAETGSVRTPSLHTIETYPTVHQMTSTVSAETDCGLVDLLRATFPGASITGAPKVATTRIIAELEDEPRGVYCGAVGAIEPGGDLEFNIAIRTAWIDKIRNAVTYSAGGGIIWDSDPESEWLEALDKAKVLVRAAEPFRLLETMAWQTGTGALLLDRHLDRLARSAVYFGFDVDLGEVKRRIGAVNRDSEAMLRVMVTSDGVVDIEVHDPPASLEGTKVALALDSCPIASDDEFLRHKTTRRTRYEEARARFPEAFDVVLWNESGEITESTIANIVLEIDGQMLTPHSDSGLLPGTFRDELIAAGRIVESRLTPEDLASADEVWLINSVRGWLAASPLTGAAPQPRLHLGHQPRQ